MSNTEKAQTFPGMSPEETEVIQTLRDRGFAVTTFNPDELAEACPRRVEDKMVERGWDVIAESKAKKG